MGSLLDLAVSLTAKTGKFSAGFKKAEKRVGRFSSRIKKFSGAILKYGGLLAGVAGVAGMGIMIKRSMEAIDLVGKLSDELDISTERLTGFQHAAALSGTSNETLTKGLQRLVRRLGEAKLGYGEGVKGLEAMGLNARKMAEMLPADALVAISEKLKNMEPATERASAAYTLFARQGQDMMNFLLMGKKGLADAQAEAEKLGISFDRVDASKVEAANDAMQRMRSVFTGIFNKMVIELAPFIERMADKFANMAADGEGWGNIMASATRKVIKGLIRIGFEFKKITGSFDELIGKATIFKGTALKLFSPERGQKLQKEGQRMVRSAAMARVTGEGALKSAEEQANEFFNSVQSGGIEKRLDTLINVTKKQQGFALTH